MNVYKNSQMDLKGDQNIQTTLLANQANESHSVEIGGKGLTLPEEDNLIKQDQTTIEEGLFTARGSKSASKTDEDASYRKWFVLAACFYANFCMGFGFNMTILNVAFLTEFGRSKAETALVQSTTIGLFLTTGVLIGAITTKYGARTVGISGGVLTTLSTITSFFATSIPYLVVTFGVFFGFGMSACYIAAATSVGEYFDGKPRLMALSLASFGAGCGAIVYAYLLDYLIREFGWRGCLLIIGGMMMNIVPCFAICEPKTRGVMQLKMNNLEHDEGEGKHYCLQMFHKLFSFKNRSGVKLHKENTIRAKIVKLLQNTDYVIFTLGMVLAIPANDSLMIFLINFLNMKGFDHPSAISLYFCLSVSNALFRLAPGVLNLIPHLNVMLIPAIITSIGAIACGFLPIATSYVHHLILLACLGVARGGNIASISVSTMKITGKDMYSTGLGVTLTVFGVSEMLAGPISGYLRDMSGSYDLALYSASAGMGVATCFFVLAPILKRCGGRRQSKGSLSPE